MRRTRVGPNLQDHTYHRIQFNGPQLRGIHQRALEGETKTPATCTTAPACSVRRIVWRQRAQRGAAVVHYLGWLVGPWLSQVGQRMRLPVSLLSTTTILVLVMLSDHQCFSRALTLCTIGAAPGAWWVAG